VLRLHNSPGYSSCEYHAKFIKDTMELTFAVFPFSTVSPTDTPV